MNSEHEALAVKLTDCKWRSYEGSGDVVLRWAVEREEAAQALRALSAERDALAAEVERLRGLVEEARDYAHNPLKPDNQSSHYKRLCAALSEG